MPRTKRVYSESGFYHVLLRGVNKQDIFSDEEDRMFFLKRTLRYKKEFEIEIHAYALMSNHMHLLIKEEREGTLSAFMHRLCSGYATYYNEKYSRVGHLFQDRFKSLPIETDRYFLTVMRYIHQNPQKAGLKSFSWTSFHSYENAEPQPLVDTPFALSLFASKESFLEFMREENDDSVELREQPSRIPNQEASALIYDISGYQPEDLQHLNRRQLTGILQELKYAGLTIRQIEKLTNINRGIIQQA